MIGVILGNIGTILTLIQFLFNIRFFGHSKLEEDQFLRLARDSFDNIITYLESYGFKKSEFAPGDKESYIFDLKKSIKKKNDFYFFIKGEIESNIFKLFDLPTEKRIDKFLAYSFAYITGYDKVFKYFLFIEKFVRIFSHKKTIYHYFSIQGWRVLNYKELLKKVDTIEKVNPLWKERYKLKDVKDFEKTHPIITRTIDLVLRKGRISEKTVFNLASSEKILFIHKYAEGFSSVYQAQRQKNGELKAKIQKAELRSALRKTAELKTELKELQESWITGPISTILEKYGFQKLFNHMEGVYVFPLSLIPEKYHNNIEQFISEEIINVAEGYLKELQKQQVVREHFEGGIKYLILSHVVSINDITIFSRERDLEISSPILSRMLFTSYLAKEDSQLSNFYINDLVRNIDFLYLVNPESKTGKYLHTNFEYFKELLWQEYSIDVFKPISLIQLSDTQINQICDKLLKKDSSIQKRFLVNMLCDKIDFYKTLDSELTSLKSKSSLFS
ncbi:hypothetical protein A3K80_00010 [Candidatus Bathyarchaeota archaeon RBG_13_38_9]|nr:MAG: hypothetical protein A3K80_00010 [Candidatus Bathyarchaeota archaeon RBG_13_38_9]